MMQSAATLSDESPVPLYRYRLERIWNPEADAIAFIMLNPSTADAHVDDPTIRRCIGFAKSWGYGRLIVGNLWAWRATDPAELRRVGEWRALGPLNPGHIEGIVSCVDEVICAWGAHGKWNNAGAAMRRRLERLGVTPRYLRLSKDGQPAHPLYLPGNLIPQAWI